ncbi:MAG: large-conductance mechanosensitive channel protein MscL [Ignavibacteria bacterium]|nr:large-conductance mechanosensitive channel protein MscL [Ignavibacteria bacterium]
MGLIKEFKEFAVKGNAFDLAVGVIIGAAFGKIVSSIVTDLLMPPIGLLFGGVNFADLKIILKQAVIDNSGKVISSPVSINIGNFIQVSVDFIIIAFVLFLVIKGMNRFLKKKEEEKPPFKVEPPRQEVLLEEIRDILKEKK